MPAVAITFLGPMVSFEHHEVELALAVDPPGDGWIANAVLSAGLDAAVAGPVGRALVAYFGSRRTAIRAADHGCGVDVLLPWPHLNAHLVGLFVTMPRRCVGAPDGWARTRGGIITTHDEADRIRYTVEHSAVGPQNVGFRLINNHGQRKELVVPDGEGGGFTLVAHHPGDAQEDALSAQQTRNGQAVTFRKAKAAGIMVNVLGLDGLDGLEPGDRVTLSWDHD